MTSEVLKFTNNENCLPKINKKKQEIEIRKIKIRERKVKGKEKKSSKTYRIKTNNQEL